MSHNIDTETLRCSCGALMCFECGWCSGQCVCLKQKPDPMPKPKMTDERFNELLNGPLHHPMPMFAITRLALALRAVVNETGEPGEKALEAYCAAREQQDRENSYCYEHGQESPCQYCGSEGDLPDDPT